MREGYISQETKEPYWLDESHRMMLASQDDDLQEALHLLTQSLRIPSGLGKQEAIKHTREMVELGIDAAMLNYGLRKELRHEVEMAARSYYLATRY